MPLAWGQDKYLLKVPSCIVNAKNGRYRARRHFMLLCYFNIVQKWPLVRFKCCSISCENIVIWLLNFMTITSLRKVITDLELVQNERNE